MNVRLSIADPVKLDGFMTLEVQGHQMRVYGRNLGSDQRPVLICNGLGQAVEILFPFMAELGDRPIVSFDAIGVGRSTVPNTPLSIEDHARAVADMLGQLGVAEYDIIGISWGGSIAQQLAHDDPNGCKKLVLAITSAGGLGSWWGSPIALSELFLPLRYSSREYGNLIGPLMYGGEAIMDPELFEEYSKNSIAPTYKGYIGQVMAMCSWTSLGWLHRLKQPTQIYSGLYDALIPAPNQYLLASRIPNSELKTFQAGHLLMYSKREEVGRMIVRFLED